MRASDASTIKNGTPGRELMMRAGKAIYETVLTSHGFDGQTAIICGSGNNAGDGYVLALLLKENNIPCELFILEDRFSEDGRYYFNECKDKNIPYLFLNADEENNVRLRGYSIYFDCIYGTGFHGEVTGIAKDVIDVINDEGNKGAYIVSVDINSGLNGDNGLGSTFVKSDLTVSVGDFKPGHFLSMAKDAMKQKINCPIGIKPLEAPFYLFEKEDCKKCIPNRPNFSNKGDYGYVALIGGSEKYSGAIRLSYLANAAMRSGAGVATVALPRELMGIVASHILESTVFPLSDNEGGIVFNEEEFTELIKHRRSIAFGMGIGRTGESAKALKFLLDNYEGNLIIDADGISDIADMGTDILKVSRPNVVLTPHLKEFSRISGHSIEEIEEAPIKTATEFAKENKVVLLLKGPSTIVTDGSLVYIIEQGSPGMATAGSGDVLSGILSAIISYGSGDLLENTAAGVYINGFSGQIASEKYGNTSMIASDTVNAIAEAIKIIEEG